MEYKIPLYPSLLPTANYSNNLNTVAFPGGADTTATDDACKTNGNCYMPADAFGIYRGFNPYGALGVTIEGSDIFPIYNNVNALDVAQCNQDKCG